MKRIIISLLLLLSIQFSYGQITAIKKQLKELFYEINFPPSKYDLRKMINSNDNFSNFHETSVEKHDIFIADIKNNYKLSYIGKAKDCQFVFWFDKGSDNNFCASIDLSYPSQYVSEGTNQYNELVKFFKSISFKSEQTPFIIEKNKVGDLYYFYSSSTTLQQDKPYAILQMRYIDYSLYDDNKRGQRYEVHFTYYIKGLK